MGCFIFLRVSGFVVIVYSFGFGLLIVCCVLIRVVFLKR